MPAPPGKGGPPQRRSKKPKLPKYNRPPREPYTTEMAIEQASRATILLELRLLWKHTGDMGIRTQQLEQVIKDRASHIKQKAKQS